MGRPFELDLAELPRTYAWARSVPIDQLCAAISKASHAPFTSIGSGGSYTAAVLAALLHERLSSPAHAATPLEFLESEYVDSQSSVFVLSASGENSDILAAFDSAASAEPRTLLAICLRKESTLANHSRRFEYSSMWSSQAPYGKEGFLAVNSLLAFGTLLERTYAAAKDVSSSLPGTLEGLRPAIEVDASKGGSPFLRTTLLALHGRWGSPAAIDLESKFSEAALGNVLKADYRSFAHGRHNWVDKKPDETAIVAFITPEDTALANQTLSKLPSSVPIICVSSRRTEAAGAISLVLGTFELTRRAGIGRNVDPGMPHIRPFGRRLYHLGPRQRLQGCSPIFPTDPIHAAARRKAVAAGEDWTDRRIQKKWLDAAQAFCSSLGHAKFSAIVMDYDGTMCDPAERFAGPSARTASLLVKMLQAGLILGVATGRGRSAREDLRKVLPRKFWSSVVIGYYNGAEVGDLADSRCPQKSGSLDPQLQEIMIRLRSSRDLQGKVTIDVRPRQLTVEPSTGTSLIQVLEPVARAANGTPNGCAKILTSTHTVDIVPGTTSKLAVVRAAAERSTGRSLPLAQLCVGDAGAWPGNDFELLSTPLSLSVDRVSSSMRSCWNLAPAGHRGSQALSDYLERIKPDRGAARFITAGLSRGR